MPMAMPECDAVPRPLLFSQAADDAAATPTTPLELHYGIYSCNLLK